jgi:hypothetical protein
MEGGQLIGLNTTEGFRSNPVATGGNLWRGEVQHSSRSTFSCVKRATVLGLLKTTPGRHHLAHASLP